MDTVSLAPPPRLTRRESEVLALVAARYANPEIAQELMISKRTVESHIAALRRKFAVADRSALRRAAICTQAMNPRTTGRPTSPWLASAGPPPATLAAPTVEDLVRRRQQMYQRRLTALSARLRNAMRMHEALAVRLEQGSSQWLVRAERVQDPAARDEARARASTLAEQAVSARARAGRSQQLLDQARERLGQA